MPFAGRNGTGSPALLGLTRRSHGISNRRSQSGYPPRAGDTRSQYTRCPRRPPVERLAAALIRRSIAFYAVHTNFDLHPQGMAGVWAGKLGCLDAHPLAPKPQADQLKIVTFLPAAHTHRVRVALSEAGAGCIGEYDLCSFTLSGTGSFRGSDRSHPFLGRAGRFEQEPEERLEMILPKHRLTEVVKALRDHHPYDEPAYDIYPLEDVRGLHQALWCARFDKKLSWSELEARVRRSLHGPAQLGGVRPDSRRKIGKIALSTGSGNSFLPLVSRLGVDAYLTGEMGYHTLWEAQERGLNVMTVGHDASEKFFPEAIIPLLESRVQEIKWIPFV